MIKKKKTLHFFFFLQEDPKLLYKLEGNPAIFLGIVSHTVSSLQ